MWSASPTTRCAGNCRTKRSAIAGRRGPGRSTARLFGRRSPPLNTRGALRELPESRERTEQLIDLCFQQRNPLYPLGELARLGEVLSEARVLAEGLGDQRRLGWVLAYQASLLSVLGEHARAIEAGERACAIAEAVGDLGLRVVANYYFGQALWLAGDLHREGDALRAVIALVQGTPLGERFGLAGLPGDGDSPRAAVRRCVLELRLSLVWACARSSPTVTSAWADSTDG